MNVSTLTVVAIRATVLPNMFTNGRIAPRK